jgi:nitrobindin-like protein/AIG2 family protein
VDALDPLIGRFRGTGTVRFPTIASYDYRETLEFVRDRERPLIHYVQRAEQREVGHETWASSHWESGFLRPFGEHMVEMTSAQDGGRLEQLRLELSVADGVLVLDGGSIALVNDPRLVRTHRRIELRGDRLWYRVSMATTRVAELTHHLEADLEREVDVFFYGSYMSRDVLRGVDIVPSRLEVAALPGFRLTIGPLANVEPAPGETVHGTLVPMTHGELERLYAHARSVLGGVYLPQPVIVHTRDGRSVPALCYVAPALPPGLAAPDYVERVARAAREHGLPADYLRHIESFGRPS